MSSTSDRIQRAAIAWLTSRINKRERKGYHAINNTSSLGRHRRLQRHARCLLAQRTGKPLNKVFANQTPGWAKLLRWVQSQAPQASVHFCLEATNAYHQGLALFLVEAQQKLSVLNPARIHYAALSWGAGNKTDKADAAVIAAYCRKENPPLWRAAAPEVRTLVALVRRLHHLQDLLGQEKNRRALPAQIPAVAASLEQTITFLSAEIERVQEQISVHINAHPGLKADQELLESIPGISAITAQEILAELPEVSRFAGAQSAAAYAGLCPRQHCSGTSVRRRSHLSKRGNPHLRKALYLPAMSAIRFNPLVKAFYERLLAAGKPKMVALAAAMRKLLLLAYGVLKNRTKFAADWKPQKSCPSA